MRVANSTQRYLNALYDLHRVTNYENYSPISALKFCKSHGIGNGFIRAACRENIIEKSRSYEGLTFAYRWITRNEINESMVKAIIKSMAEYNANKVRRSRERKKCKFSHDKEIKLDHFTAQIAIEFLRNEGWTGTLIPPQKKITL